MRHSFAQNFEDVLLHRCFADTTDGFYVDVGAAAPAAHSVTLNFYLRGWRGLHVEPIPERAQELRWCRPRDLVVEAAASDADGAAILNRTTGAGGLSSLTPEFLGPSGERDDIWPIEVRARTLRGLLAEHHVEAIHFLKIDVEGAEHKVIAAMDFQRWRPIVLLVEAVTPTRPPRPHFEAWEAGVVGADYTFVFFDGLNRYYLRNESLDLRRHFEHPVCAFDPVARFEDFGEPLINRSHPNHAFALNVAKMLLRGLASGSIEPSDWLYRDYAPQLLESPASVDHANWAIRHLLAREPQAGEAEALIAGGALTVKQALDAITAGDAFRCACACAAA